MRVWAAVAAVALTSGCANVKVFQRGSCWVRQTESFPKTVREEIGPCAPSTPRWAEDRVARLVQECMFQSNYRWQNEAVAAWTRGQAIPAHSEQSIMRECMQNAGTALITENEGLKRRIAELSSERDSLASVAQQEREHLRSSQDRMTDALGEAAKKPAPSAFATANSAGTASTQSDQTAAPATPVQISTPPMPVVQVQPTVLPPAPAPTARPAPPPTCATNARRGRGENSPLCAPPRAAPAAPRSP